MWTLNAPNIFENKKMISSENFSWDFFLMEIKTLWRNRSKKSHCYKIVLGPYNFQVDYFKDLVNSCSV